jgi:hypothetical protein
VPGQRSGLGSHVRHLCLWQGTDAGTCAAPTNPCRTFQFAVNQTAAGGEVKALDPADYSPVTINTSISITGVDGAGIDTKGGITLNAPTPGVIIPTINLANLLIQNVSGSGTAGISVRAVPLKLTITHCTAGKQNKTSACPQRRRGRLRNAATRFAKTIQGGFEFANTGKSHAVMLA